MLCSLQEQGKCELTLDSNFFFLLDACSVTHKTEVFSACLLPRVRRCACDWCGCAAVELACQTGEGVQDEVYLIMIDQSVLHCEKVCLPLMSS